MTALHKPVLGLIGGIGSGKSRIAAALAQRRAAIISGDQLGHEALTQPDIRQRVVARWGPSVLNETGEIERRRVGAIVFADVAELRALEQIVFPYIEAKIQEAIARSQADPTVPWIVLDAAVMLEAGWDRWCDVLIYVDAPLADRQRRLLQQRRWSEKEVTQRSQAQWSLAEKRARAHIVLENADGVDVDRQIEHLLQVQVPKEMKSRLDNSTESPTISDNCLTLPSGVTKQSVVMDPS